MTVKINMYDFIYCMCLVCFLLKGEKLFGHYHLVLYKNIYKLLKLLWKNYSKETKIGVQILVKLENISLYKVLGCIVFEEILY